MTADGGNRRDETDDQVLAGFRTAHQRTGLNLIRTLETAASTTALAEVLIAKGLIALDELDRARRSAEDRLRSSYADAGLTVALTETSRDKYTVDTSALEIDCASIRPTCRSACCRLRFALTEQDIDEGIVRWTLAEPYMNRVGTEGWCTHIDGDGGCDVYEHRPIVCRTYDCRNDSRIWADFDERVLSDELAATYAEIDRGRSGSVPVAMPTRRVAVTG